jgi:hypothetical protein
LRADLERDRIPAKCLLEIGLALNEALEHPHRNGLANNREPNQSFPKAENNLSAADSIKPRHGQSTKTNKTYES